MPPQAAELFRGYRSVQGEELVLEQNLFIEFNLTRGMLTEMAESDHDVYRAPFLEPASRKPMLAWSREFPLDGELADVVEVVRRYGRWMAETPEVPKLLMAVDNGTGLGSPEMISWAAETFAAVEVEPVGPGGHHTPEDQPDAIGVAIGRWLRRHALPRDQRWPRERQRPGERQWPREHGAGRGSRGRRGRPGGAGGRRRHGGAGGGDPPPLRPPLPASTADVVAARRRRGRDPGNPDPGGDPAGVLRGEARLLTWAYRIGVNYLLNLWRKTPQEAQQLSLDEFGAALADGLADADYRGPEATVLTEEVRLSCTQAMLQCLERGERIAFVLSDIFGSCRPRPRRFSRPPRPRTASGWSERGIASARS